jgi:GxxExxY protein
VDMNELCGLILASAVEVHDTLGPGLHRSVYEECICHEFNLRSLLFERQKQVLISYKGAELDCGCRIGLVVEDAVVVEIESCEKIESIHKARILTYLKLAGLQVGLLLNFDVAVMTDGIVRVVNEAPD